MTALLRLVGRLLVSVCRVGALGAWRGARLVARHIVRLLRRRRDTFGSARWARLREMRRAGVLGGDGLILGKVGNDFLRLNNPEGSALVFAPQGAGKGVGIVVPNLLSYPGSVVVTDPKGENFAITARRRAELGDVRCIDLVDPERSDGFNPLDTIRLGTIHEETDANLLARMMLVPDPRAEQHWRDKAVSWLTGLILYVAYARLTNPEWSNLGALNKIVCAGKAELAQVLVHMMGFPVEKVRDVAREIERGMDATEEAWNVLSNMAKATDPWSVGKPLGVIGRRSSFALSDLSERTLSLFIKVPESQLELYGPVMRVVVGLAMDAVVRAGKENVPAAHRPLFLLDEAAALGYLEPLEKGMGYLRAFARALMIFQDLHQLRVAYPKADSMMANCAALVGWCVNDIATAEMLSKRIGSTTVSARSAGMSQSSDAVLRHQQQGGESEAGRPLMDAAEIIRLEGDRVLAFVGRGFPIRAERVRYYAEACFAGMWDRWRDGCGGVQRGAWWSGRSAEIVPLSSSGNVAMPGRRAG